MNPPKETLGFQAFCLHLHRFTHAVSNMHLRQTDDVMCSLRPLEVTKDLTVLPIFRISQPRTPAHTFGSRRSSSSRTSQPFTRFTAPTLALKSVLVPFKPASSSGHQRRSRSHQSCRAHRPQALLPISKLPSRHMGHMHVMDVMRVGVPAPQEASTPRGQSKERHMMLPTAEMPGSKATATLRPSFGPMFCGPTAPASIPPTLIAPARDLKHCLLALEYGATKEKDDECPFPVAHLHQKWTRRPHESCAQVP